MLYGSSLPFYCGTRSYLDNEGMSTREQGDTSHAFLASACHEFRTHRSSPTTTRTLILPWYLAVGPHCSFGKSYAVPAHLLGKTLARTCSNNGTRRANMSTKKQVTEW